jgi:hypothetical protein
MALRLLRHKGWRFYSSTGSDLDSFGAAVISASSVIADADYGDITVSGSGLVWTIDNDVVTYAKMQNVSASDRLLGRKTAGSGDVEEITVAGDITQSGSTFTIGNNAVITAKILDANVTNAKLANMAGWTFKIRNNSASGVPSDAAVGDLTTSTPVATDFLIGYKADGTIRKYAASDFGVTGGGGVSFKQFVLMMTDL